MANTNVSHLNDSMQKTNEWLKMVAERLGTDDYEKAYQALRAVLHVLRDRLTIEEGADLAAQMPLILKGVFYDSFRPANLPVKIKTKEDFFSKVEANSRGFGDLDGALATMAVFEVIEEKISDGELADIQGNLPLNLKDLLE